MLVARLQPQDFELLIDLILARDGWVRLGNLGGTTEGIDIEVQNASSDEIAFVQVKSAATQKVFEDYVTRFRARRNRYSRMFFAVHTFSGKIQAPPDEPIQVWTRERISELVVRHGLGTWIAKKI